MSADPFSLPERVTLSLDRTGKSYQLSINAIDTDYYGHGYRLMGPKYTGSSSQIKEVTLDQRDVREIVSYLRRVPAVVVEFFKGWDGATAPGRSTPNWHWTVFDLGAVVASGFDPDEQVARAAALAAYEAHYGPVEVKS